jgi:hypothetical protein
MRFCARVVFVLENLETVECTTGIRDRNLRVFCISVEVIGDVVYLVLTVFGE